MSTKLRAITVPIMGKFPRKPAAELKPLVQVPVPTAETAAKPAGNETAKAPVKPKAEKAASVNEPENKAAPEAPTQKKQEAIFTPPPDPEAPQPSKIPQPYKSVDPLVALASANAPVLMVMLRQLRDMKGPMPDTRSGALEVMSQLQTRFKAGQDITDLQDRISLHVTGQQERTDLLNMLSDSMDQDRLVEIFISRAKFEDFVHACLRRSDLNVVEGMALNGYMNNQLADILSRIRPKQSRAENISTREPNELVQRANLPTQLQHKQIQRQFDEASPSEREILRKLGFKIETMLAARITKTTTETVEIVQQDGAKPA